MPESTRPALDFMRPTVKFVIGLLLLLLVRFIVRRLPMLEGSLTIPPTAGEPGDPFVLPYFALGVAVADTFILALIVKFGREVGGLLRERYPTFEDISKLTTLGTLLVAAFVAYNAYDLIGPALLGKEAVYNGVFLIFTGIPLLGLLFVGYKNTEQLADLVMGRLSEVQKLGPKTCPECGTQVPGDAKFCAECGNRFASVEE